LTNFGILQLTFADDVDYDRIEDGDELAIDNIQQAIEKDTVEVRNVTKGYTFKTNCNLSPRQKEIVLSGGLLNYVGKNNG
jgi:aconitate hydratase